MATTCLHAQRLASVSLGESVAVIGLGVSGQLHVQLAKARGAGKVIGISRSRFKNDLAEATGRGRGDRIGPRNGGESVGRNGRARRRRGD